MDHARYSVGLVTQSGGPGHQHASVSEAGLPDLQALRSPHIKSSSPANSPSMPSPPSSSSHSHLSHSSSQPHNHTSSTSHSFSNPKSPSSTTQHLTAFNPSDPKTLSTEPTSITSNSTPSLSNNDNHSVLTEASTTSINIYTSASTAQANTELNCERRRPEEEDTQRRLTMSSQLMSKTVTPFLKDHIPGLYSPLAKRDSIAVMQRQNKDPNSRYCYRHRPDSKCRRAADESKMVNIQHELEQLKPDDQQAITHVWSLFSAAPSKQRDLMLQGIMTQCCFPQLSKVSREVADQLKIDFISALPPEVAYKILCYLDPLSLCKAALVSRQWRALADDDQVWYRMCEQHIDRKCTKCGFGLPLLERKRLRDWTRIQQLAKSHHMHIEKPRIPTHAPTLPAPISLREVTPLTLKRDANEFLLEDIRNLGGDGGSIAPGAKRQCKAITASPSKAAKSATDKGNAHSHDCHDVRESSPTDKDLELARAIELERKPRAWKDVYRDRFRVGNNWRNGRCEVKVFRGHSNGVTCLQIDDVMMATGSYDATIRIWNLDTGEQARVLRGHTQGIRSLQFDDKILVSGSLDGTMKIWNWHTGELLNTLVCHQSGVISVNLDGEWLASGSADKTIKVFNLKTKESFTLKGHSDWVNQVRIDGTASRTIFSASDDCKVKLWDLESKRCIRTFEGHVGHVQQVLTLPADFEPDEDPEASGGGGGDATSVVSNGGSGGRGGSSPGRYASPPPSGEEYTRDAYGPGFIDKPDRPLPCRYILSAALDSTIKCWDTATGKCVRTFFGHLEGVWALAGDTLRVVSGANDTMVKVWEPRSGKCEQTWTGHRGPVTCVGLSDSRLASGSEDGEVRLYSFQDRAGGDDCGTPSQ